VTGEDSARLFLAVWPDARVRDRLVGDRDAWRWPPGATPVAGAALHLTLHYLGAFARARTPALAASLAAVPVPGMVLRPEAAELWKGGIAVLRIEADPALASLRTRLGAILAEAGVALDARPFAPHVTLARRAAQAEPPSVPAPFVWRARSFTLVESMRADPPRYEVLGRFGTPVRRAATSSPGGVACTTRRKDSAGRP
jgi:2'-5' RNA ligase